MIKQVLQSFAIVIVISSIFGYTLGTIMGGWQHAFVFSMLLQLIGGYFYNDITIRSDSLKKESILNERFDILSRNIVSFPCPCGGNTFEEVVYPGQDNNFVCEKCNQEIRVDVSFTPIVITKPLLSDPLEKIKTPVE